MVDTLNFKQKIPFTHHLVELKDRLIRTTLVVMVFFGIAFYFMGFLRVWLQDPLPDQFMELTFITPTEPFFTAMKIAFMVSIFVSMPMILHQSWQFIAPGLKVKEKKITAMFVAFGTFFFVGGGVFCYYLVLPLGLKFLLNYGSNWWKMQVTIGFYFSFVVKLMLAFGFAFQTPLLMVLLTKFGLINTIKMKLYRKWAFLGMFVFAALITPPDIITQVLLAFPLYCLYEFGVVISAFFEDPKVREAARQSMEDEKRARKAAKEAEFAAKDAKKKASKKKVIKNVRRVE